MTPRTYRTEILVPAIAARTADDLLAEAMSGARSGSHGECETGTAQRFAGGMVSLRLTFTAPDDDTAIVMVRDAQRAIPGPCDVSVLTTGTGRHFRRLDPHATPGSPIR